MAKQTINQGTAPTGSGGDTFRSGSAKLQANDDEIYNYLGDGTNLNKLGTAAFKSVGSATGNVMEVGAFGLGGIVGKAVTGDIGLTNLPVGFYSGNSIANAPIPNNETTWGYLIQQNLNSVGAGYYEFQTFSSIDGETWTRAKVNQIVQPWYRVWTTKRTTVDANGFIKSASPIIKLYADHIELNDETKEQEITFEKIGTGDYLLKGSSGFAQEGWYIETPKDANGNLLVAVVYEQLENGDISVKTYDYMLNNKGRIVADTETPLDIPEARWIDIRLQELPQPEFVPPVSNTPASFQPTGIAQAVSEMMNGTEQ